MKKAIILFSGNGSTMKAILDYCTEIHFQCVLTNNPNAKGIQHAFNKTVDTIVIDSSYYNSNDEYSTTIGEFLTKMNPDLVILAGWLKIFTPSFFNAYKGKIINIHPSINPRYNGMYGKQIHQAVLNSKDEYHGFKIHEVIEEVDEGKTIMEYAFKVPNQITIDELINLVQTKEREKYPQIISSLLDDENFLFW